MKVLYATRLFSGLETSLINGVWEPTGVPTIYKFIEELDDRHNVKFIFSAKDNGNGYSSSWNSSKDKKIVVQGLNQPVKVLTGTSYYFSWIPRSLAINLREVRQYIHIFIEVLLFNPEIIYCDHANVFIGSFLSRIQKKIPVVFRVMGVYPSMRDSLVSNRFIDKAYKLAYKSPFSLVICTQDGSGIELWLNKAIANNTKIEILLNGVDSINELSVKELDYSLKTIPLDKKIILFVGKLETYKGCYDFLNAFVELINKGVENIHALIIGTGSEEKKLKTIVKKNIYKHNVTFINRLPHSQILAVHKMSCIYVSMNYLGNLSNSNLEAIQSNDCMIIPTFQPNNGIDVVTNKMLGNSVISTPIKNPILLADCMHNLIISKSKRVEKSELLAKRKLNFIWSWEDRVKAEVKLLEKVLNDKRN